MSLLSFNLTIPYLTFALLLKKIYLILCMYICVCICISANTCKKLGFSICSNYSFSLSFKTNFIIYFAFIKWEAKKNQGNKV